MITFTLNLWLIGYILLGAAALYYFALLPFFIWQTLMGFRANEDRACFDITKEVGDGCTIRRRFKNDWHRANDYFNALALPAAYILTKIERFVKLYPPKPYLGKESEWVGYIPRRLKKYQ